MIIEKISNTRPVQVFWAELSACEHMVQIYEDDLVFMATLEGFVLAGLHDGEAVIVIATHVHLELLELRLRAAGIDLDALRGNDKYIALDAEKTLAKFMLNGWPDDNLFHTTISRILVRARGGDGRRVRAFGEMVALLWIQGHHAATMQLERQWHDLCRTESFPLFCAYPKAGFTQDASASMAQLCAVHSRAIAA